MRALVITLAILGTILLLGIGGCVGCVALVAASIDRPDHHNRQAIEARYESALTAAQKALATDGPVDWRGIAPELVAVFAVEETGYSDDYDLVYVRGDAAVDKTSHVMVNGGGSVGLRMAGTAARYPAVELADAAGREWLLCFDDWQPAAAPAASGEPAPSGEPAEAGE